MTDRVEQVEKSLEDARAQLGRLFAFKDDHRKGLQRLSSQHGTTRNRVDDLTQVSATHGKQLARLTEALEQLKARGEILGEHVTDEQLENIQNQLTRLDGQAKAFSAELQLQIDSLQQRLDELQEQVDMQGPEISRAHDRLDDVEKAPMLEKDPNTTVIKIDGNVKSSAPWVKGIIVGAIAGVLCYIALNAWVDNWSSTKNFWFSLILGVAITCLVASVETFHLKLDGKLLWGTRERNGQEATDEPTIIRAVTPDDDTRRLPVYDQDAEEPHRQQGVNA